MLSFVYLSALCLVCSPALPHQTATSLLRRTARLDDGSVVLNVYGPVGNQNGGYSALLRVLEPGSTTASYLAFGSQVDGLGEPEVFLRQQTDGQRVQAGWSTNNARWDLDNQGRLLYEALVSQTPVPPGLPSIWRDDELLVALSSAVPGHPGASWDQFEEPQFIGADAYAFLASARFDLDAELATIGVVANGQFLLQSFDSVLGGSFRVPGPGATHMESLFSPDGSHFLIRTTLEDPAGGPVLNGMIYDNDVLQVGGAPVIQGQPVPTSLGADPGDTWRFLDPCDLDDQGNRLLFGSVLKASGEIEWLLLRNESVLLRTTDPWDGFTPIARQNQRGDVLVVTFQGFPTTYQITLNGLPVLESGDLVDVTGDGLPDPGFAFLGPTGVLEPTMTLDDDGTIRLLGDVTDPSDWQVLEHLIEIRGSGELGSPFCSSSPNSTGGSAVIRATGSVSLSEDGLMLIAEPVPNLQTGLFLYGPTQVQVPFGNGVRCVAPDGSIGVARLEQVPTQFTNRIQSRLDFSNPPTAATTITPGSTWHFQAWFRDPVAGGSGFDLSDGLSLTFEP